MRLAIHLSVLAVVMSVALMACSTTTVTETKVVRTFGVQAPTSTENVYANIPATLENRDWRIVSLASTALIKTDKELTMRLQQGRVAGYGGCNQYNGSYKFDNTRFIFASIVASALTCVVTSPQEQTLFKNLQKTRYWHIDRQTEHLQFLDKKQQLLVEYELVSNKAPL